MELDDGFIGKLEDHSMWFNFKYKLLEALAQSLHGRTNMKQYKAISRNYAEKEDESRMGMMNRYGVDDNNMLKAHLYILSSVFIRELYIRLNYWEKDGKGIDDISVQKQSSYLLVSNRTLQQLRL